MASLLRYHRAVKHIEILLRSFIKADRVRSVGQYLGLFEVLIRKQDFIDLQQGTLIVHKEIEQIVSVHLSELVKFDAALSQICQFS